MELSIVIVNFNVKHFLEQCLASVMAACKNQPGVEVYVIDNASTDGDYSNLKKAFDEVHWVLNKENKGFASANNQVFTTLRGRYVLFLNPDTIIGENSLRDCLSFLDSHPDAGALGVRMIDGSGNYLKESKRGFPTPWVAFCKMSGFSYIFPRSRLFSGYYLGNLPENSINKVDALPGAFMLVRKNVLEITGGFDERFFMYAEDIDLSFRIQKTGHFNYYLPEVTIIHFKGESTRKNARYVKLFYTAMGQFVEKHANSPFERFSSHLLKAAIGIVAIIAYIFQKEKRPEPTELPITAEAVGDDASINEVSAVFTPKIGNIIYCQGKTYPFSKIIEQIQVMGKDQPSFIHAQGTTSLVGSSSSDNRGISYSVKSDKSVFA